MPWALPLLLLALLLGAPTAAAPFPTPTGTPYFPPTPSGRYRIVGHIAGPGCTGNEAGVTVTLYPGGRTARTGSRGEFQFDDLAYGGYNLQFTPNCPLIPCFADAGVFIDGSGDELVSVCRDDCPATALISRYSGEPGSLLDVSGRCDAARDDSVAVWLDDREIGTLAAGTDGVYRGTVTIPADTTQGTQHRVRVVLGDREIAAADFMTAYGGAPCVGDCNRDGRVTIDELLRGIRIALGLEETSACYSIDSSINGVVSIEELVTGVQRALEGCRLPDLVPLDAHYSRCVDYPCSTAEQVTHFMEVCIANQGDADSPGFLVQDDNGNGYGFGPPLPAGEQECVEMPLALFPAIEVDAGHDIVEQDETNNVLETAIPASTACDVRPPPCTPTPPPTEGPTPSPT